MHAMVQTWLLRGCHFELFWLLQVVFPAMRVFLKPGRSRATDGSIVELTRLEKLYRIFERC